MRGMALRQSPALRCALRGNPLPLRFDPLSDSMALNMNGEYVLPADKATVWAKLNDPAVLQACIPGCEEFSATGDNAYHAVAKVKIGPVSA